MLGLSILPHGANNREQAVEQQLLEQLYELSLNMSDEAVKVFCENNPQLLDKDYVEEKLWPFLVENLRILQQEDCVHNLNYENESLPMVELELNLLSVLYYQIWKSIDSAPFKDEILIRLVFETNNWLRTSHDLLASGEVSSYLPQIETHQKQTDLLEDYLISFKQVIVRMVETQSKLPELLPNVAPCITIFLQPRKYAYLLANEILESDTAELRESLEHKANDLKQTAMFQQLAAPEFDSNTLARNLDQDVTNALMHSKTPEPKLVELYHQVRQHLTKFKSDDDAKVQLQLKDSTESITTDESSQSKIKSFHGLLDKFNSNVSRPDFHRVMEMTDIFTTLSLIFEGLLIYPDSFSVQQINQLLNGFTSLQQHFLEQERPLCRLIQEHLKLYHRSCLQISVQKQRVALQQTPSHVTEDEWPTIIDKILDERISAQNFQKLRAQAQTLMSHDEFARKFFNKYLSYTTDVKTKFDNKPNAAQQYVIRQNLCRISLRTLQFIDGHVSLSKLGLVNIIYIESLTQLLKLTLEREKSRQAPNYRKCLDEEPNLLKAFDIYIRCFESMVTMSDEQAASQPLVWDRTVDLIKCLMTMDAVHAHNSTDMLASYHGRNKHLQLLKAMLDALDAYEDAYLKLTTKHSLEDIRARYSRKLTSRLSSIDFLKSEIENVLLDDPTPPEDQEIEVMLTGLKQLLGTSEQPCESLETETETKLREKIKQKNSSLRQLKEELQKSQEELLASQQALTAAKSLSERHRIQGDKLKTQLQQAQTSHENAKTKSLNQAAAIKQKDTQINRIQSRLTQTEQALETANKASTEALEQSKAHQRRATKSVEDKRATQQALEQAQAREQKLKDKLASLEQAIKDLKTEQATVIQNLEASHQQQLKAESTSASALLDDLSAKFKALHLSDEALQKEVADLKANLAAKEQHLYDLTRPIEEHSNPGFRKIVAQPLEPVENITQRLLTQEKQYKSVNAHKFVIPKRFKPKLTEIRSLMQTLNAIGTDDHCTHRTYIDGGFPRAVLAGKSYNDIDLITTRSIEWVLSRGGIIGDFKFEQINPNVPHLFRDFKRKVDLVCHPNLNLLEEAQCRDLGCNALFLDEDFNLIDPTGLGYDHAVSKQLKFIGEPAERLEQDASRAMRILRLSYEYNWPLDSETLSLVSYYATQLHQVPYGVFAHNLRALLTVPEGLSKSIQMGLLGKFMGNHDFANQLKEHPAILDFWQDVLANPKKYSSPECRFTNHVALLLSLQVFCLPPTLCTEKLVDDFLNRWSHDSFGDEVNRNIQRYKLCQSVELYKSKLLNFVKTKPQKPLSATAKEFKAPSPGDGDSQATITYQYNSQQFPSLKSAHKSGHGRRKGYTPSKPQ